MAMKILNHIGTFMYALDKYLWGDDIETNKYFATISVLLVAVLGGWASGGYAVTGFIHSVMGWSASRSVIAVMGFVILIYGLNLAETIVSSSGFSTFIARSFLILVVMALAFVFGYYVSDAMALYASIAVLLIMLGSPLLKRLL